MESFGVVLVCRTIQISSVQLNNTPCAHGIVHPPLQEESLSVPIFTTFAHLHPAPSSSPLAVTAPLSYRHFYTDGLESQAPLLKHVHNAVFCNFLLCWPFPCKGITGDFASQNFVNHYDTIFKILVHFSKRNFLSVLISNLGIYLNSYLGV